MFYSFNIEKTNKLIKCQIASKNSYQLSSIPSDFPQE